MLKYIILLILNIWIFKSAQAICNQCNRNNGAACISQTEFQLCFDGKPNSTKTYKCLNPNEICTKQATICMDSSLTSGLLPACGDTTNCGKCENLNDGAYTCTSRTTFTMCSSNSLTEIRNSCPENQMCDATIAAQGLNPCVLACNEPKIKFCDLVKAIDEPKVTDPQETTTVIFSPTLPTQNPADNLCSQQTAVGRYAYPNDTTCRKYVYCFIKNGTMQTTFMTCPAQLYFNPALRTCAKLKPEGCI